ncbi:hypothetical protein [Leuconostoc pseudomesenteroides]|uniref:class III lanthionine synthetase LanKC N-terminal domain-containing protein n=1 Tax=Leuconostoc pseudomesenteroides TaxID=33968 RepID=UPI0032DE4097
MFEVYQGIFKYINRDSIIPKQGWKIHISASIQDKKNILNIVSRICMQENVPFKYIKNFYSFKKNISNYERPWELGKYITIYPNSEEQAGYLMEKLYKLLIDTNGPKIISDFSFKNSNNISFRYGINTVKNKKDPNEFFLHGPNGEVERDTPKMTPGVPIWVKMPSGWLSDNKKSVLLEKYSPYAIVRQSATGNIYLAKNWSGKKVIVKEAKHWTLRDLFFDNLQLRENEWNNSSKSDHSLNPIEKITENFSTFFIYDYIDGIDLQSYLSKNNFMINTPNSRKVFSVYQKILLKIINIVDSLHKNKMFNIDIHAKNFMIDDNMDVFLVDLETINFKHYSIRSTGFWIKDMQNKTSEKADVIRLYFLIIYSISRQNILLNQVSLLDVQNITYKLVANVLDKNTLKSLVFVSLNNVGISSLKSGISNLSFLGYNFQIKQNIYHPNLSTKDTISMLEISKTNKNDSIGLAGLAGEILLLNFQNVNDVQKYNNIISKVRSLLINKEGNIYVLSSEQNKIVDPYIMNGVAGLLLALSTVPIDQVPDFTLKIAHSIAIPFSKYGDYANGLLGIADSILSIAFKLNDTYLFNKGLKMLNTSEYFIFNIKGKKFMPIPNPDNKKYYEKKSSLDIFIAIKMKWRQNLDHSF